MKTPKIKRLFGKTLKLKGTSKDYKSWEYSSEEGTIVIIRLESEWTIIVQAFGVSLISGTFLSERSCRNDIRSRVQRMTQGLGKLLKG